MTDTAPAAVLRAAAATLRALATAASTDTDGPTTQWSAEPLRSGYSSLYGDYRTLDDGRRIAWPPLLHGGDMRHPVRMHTQHADYIAAMDPTVGLALADWLDAEAGCLSGPDVVSPAALAVARLVLGTTTGQPENAQPAVDRATVLREAADHAEAQRQFERCTGPRRAAQTSENVGALRVADRLRRLADEAQQPTPAPADTVLTAADVSLAAADCPYGVGPGDGSGCIKSSGHDGDHIVTPGVTVVPCSQAVLHQSHIPHVWWPQPGMAYVHCPGSNPVPAEGELTDGERQFLSYALHLADEQMASRGDEFVDSDRAALVKLQRLAKAGCTCCNINKEWVEVPHTADCAATPAPAEETKP